MSHSRATVTMAATLAFLQAATTGYTSLSAQELGSKADKTGKADLARLPRDNLLVYRDKDGKAAPVKSVEDWAKRRTEVVRGMEAVMGKLPGEAKRCPLDMKVEEEVEDDTYVRRLVTYASEPGGRVPAYLLIPKDVLAGKMKAPAILCLHGTNNEIGHGTVVGLGMKPNRGYALELALRGYVTLAPNYPLLAKYQPDLNKLGWQSGTLKAVWDNMRGLDLLASLPYVDQSKGFGTIGHSLGGHNSVYTAVFDDRLTAVVSSCGLDSFLDYYKGDPKNWDPEKGWCQTRYMRKLADYKGRLAEIPFDFHEMVGALAPRHVFIIAPTKDSNFRADSVDRIADAARPVFRLHGHEKRLSVEHPECEHDFPQEMREAAYKLFDTVLAAAPRKQPPPPENRDESKVAPYQLPDPLVLKNGDRVTDARAWTQKRRPEVLELFRTHVYGRQPSTKPELKFKVFDDTRGALKGKAIRKQVSVHFSADEKGPRMDLLLYIPADAKQPVPAFLGLNFGGNQAVHADPAIKMSESWQRPRTDQSVVNNRATEASRGTESRRWDIDAILDRGYAVATAYYGDIDPDYDDGFKNGVHPLFYQKGQTKPAADEWGSIAAWAWGLSRALDYLERDPAINAKQVAVLGHSRLGKTALWAGAEDERFAIVISNNSGCGGAKLSRRSFGESIHQINSSFPHWFCDNFEKYNERVNDLPVDQHMLIALMAPRPVYVASAEKDLHADPRGEFLAALHAEPVYRLFGAAGLGVKEPPPLNEPKMGTVGYHFRSGVHDVTAYDWRCYLDFADRHFGRKITAQPATAPADKQVAKFDVIEAVEKQPLVAATERLIEAMEYVGALLAEADVAKLKAATKLAKDADAVKAIQGVLDPLCLAQVTINPESRVSAIEGIAPKKLVRQGWSTFLVKVNNGARITPPLVVSSPQADRMYEQGKGARQQPLTTEKLVSPEESAQRFLDIAVFDKQPLKPKLSGLEVEYRIVQLYSRDAGRREATLSFHVGQGTQDLGFRSEVPILFESAPAVQVVLGILDHDRKPTTAALVVRDRFGRVYPNPARRSAPDFFFHNQVYRADGETIHLPPGEYTAVVSRGPEYLVETHRFNVPKDRASYRQAFQLTRWIEPKKRGWYSGDHHVHAAGCADYDSPTEGVTPDDMMRHILGEDLNVGCVLSWGPCWYSQKKYFEGKTSALSRPNYLMRYDVEVSGFPSSHAGHLCLLRLKEDDYPGTTRIEEWPSWTLPVLKWGQKQGGVVGYTHSGWGLAVPDYGPDGKRLVSISYRGPRPTVGKAPIDSRITRCRPSTASEPTSTSSPLRTGRAISSPPSTRRPSGN